MVFRSGVVTLQVPILKDGVNIGTATVEEGVITLEFRGGYATYVNELVDMILAGGADGLKAIEPACIPAKPYEEVPQPQRPARGPASAFDAYQKGGLDASTTEGQPG